MKREHAKGWALGLTALLIGGGVGYGLSAASPGGKSMIAGAPARGDARSEATSAALGREVESLRTELKAAVRRMDSVPRAATPAGARPEEETRAAADTGQEPVGRSAAEEADAAAREHRARVEAIEDGLQREPADAAWAPGATATLQKVFKDGTAAEIAGSSLKSVDCRATLCRVNVTHEDPGAFMRFMHEFHGLVGQELPRMTLQPERNADGSVDTLVYLAREGHDFPSPEANP